MVERRDVTAARVPLTWRLGEKLAVVSAARHAGTAGTWNPTEMQTRRKG